MNNDLDINTRFFIMTSLYKYIVLIAIIVLILILIISCYIKEKNILSYIISKNEATKIITALNESTGKIEFSGTNISNILTSVNNAIAEGGTIKIKEGKYTPSSSVKFTKSIKIKAEGNVTFNWNNTAGQFLFILTGTELSTASLTENVRTGANIISIDNNSASYGDLILIYDDTIWNPTYYPKWKTGELHEISSMSGNNITIIDTTINSFSTTRNGRIRLIRPITVEIDGITIEGAGSTSLCRGILLKYNKNSLIHNSKFQKCGRDEITVSNSYQTTIENNIIGDNIYPGFGYGIVVEDSSAYTNITNNYFYNARHCIAIGGSGIVGQSRDTTISSNIFNDSTGTSYVLDAHPIAESYYIYNNKIYSPPMEGAIVSGARVTKIAGNTIIGGLGIYNTYTKTKSPGFVIEITDNQLIDSRYVFRNRGNTAIYQINIENNVISGDILGITQLYDLRNPSSFIVSGNQFNSINKGTGSWGIYVKDSNNGIISNNTINNSYYSGIKIDSVNNSLISGNIITNYNNYGASGEKGILINNSSYNIIADNILKKSGDTNTYGITEVRGSDYNRIFNNNLNQVGTIISNRIQLLGNNSDSWNNQGYNRK